MSKLAGFWTRVRRSLSRRRFEAEMQAEMLEHLERDIERRVAAGEAPSEARRRAVLTFGHVDSLQEEVRDRNLGRWFDQTWQDLRYAARGLRKAPGFTAAAVLTLAIGIGGNTAIFSVVSGLLLNPLPYPDSERIVQINESARGDRGGISGGGTFLEWQEHQQHFEVIAARHQMSHNFVGRGDPELVRGWEVTPDYLSVFGLRPVLGRDFRAEDDAAGADQRVTIVSHRFWRNQLDGDAAAIGSLVQFDGEAYEVIGVLEPDALMDPEIDFLTPTGLLSDPQKQGRGFHYVLNTVARLKPGATPEAAAAHLNAVKQRFKHLYPERKREWVVRVRTLQEQIFGGAREPLVLLMWSVGAVLLIACVNVANLLLARTSSRGSELALRLALGASKSRIIRQMLTESLLLALLGGAAGVALGALAIGPLTIFTGVSEFQRLEIGLDERVLLFALAASVATGLLFGLLPAIRATGSDVNEQLKHGGRSGGAGRRRSVQSLLIVLETAMTAGLLVVAGLIMRSFVNVAGEDVGFERQGALTFRVNASGENAATIETRTQFADRIIAELERIPGVTHAGLITNMPMNGRTFYGDAVRRADQPETDADIPAGFDAVSPGYFAAMGIPLLRGRTFTEADNRVDAPKVMLINQSMVARFFPDGEDPLGHHIQFKGAPHEVVGIVGDVRRFSIESESPLQVYLPMAQFPWATHYIVRSNLPPTSLVAQVRRAVRTVQSDQPIYEIETLDALARETLSFRSMILTLLSVFAGAALILACVGIYGVMAYSVNQRTREMGIRLALGALGRDIVRLVVRDGLAIVLAGLILGAFAAGFGARFLQSQLYEVGSLDPVTYVGVALLLAAAGVAACVLPARRACRVDPMTSLRSE